jgi:hypothetical protein
MQNEDEMHAMEDSNAELPVAICCPLDHTPSEYV